MGRKIGVYSVQFFIGQELVVHMIHVNGAG